MQNFLEITYIYCLWLILGISTITLILSIIGFYKKNSNKEKWKKSFKKSGIILIVSIVLSIVALLNTMSYPSTLGSLDYMLLGVEKVGFFLFILGLYFFIKNDSITQKSLICILSGIIILVTVFVSLQLIDRNYTPQSIDVDSYYNLR